MKIGLYLLPQPAVVFSQSHGKSVHIDLFTTDVIKNVCSLWHQDIHDVLFIHLNFASFRHLNTTVICIKMLDGQKWYCTSGRQDYEHFRATSVVPKSVSLSDLLIHKKTSKLHILDSLLYYSVSVLQ